jgi:branched-chain amino acid aminotransferase
VIEIARSRGFEVVERHIMPGELSGFSECFIVGTAAEVTPVAQIAEHRFRPGNLSLSLMEDFSLYARGKLEAAA